ncbi:MAG TPA: SulP family inorganic anion transporter [Puia sp.]|nr:SulP family inorganic anion transporter [Puia sp.]
MRRAIKYYRIIWLKNDLPAGVSVFLVALPLCLGIALASGAPLYAGLLSGIIGGLIVALVSGSQLAVSGPAAGLTTIVAASIITLGDYRIFLLAVMIAGLFQLVIGLLKFGAIANYFPSSVIKGMLAAIGIMLIAKQIPFALGFDKPDFWTSGFSKIFSSTHFSWNVANLAGGFSKGTILITIFSLSLLIILQQPFAKKAKIIPAPLLVVIFGIIINIFFIKTAPDLSLKQTQLVNIPSNIFSNIAFPDFSKLFSNTKIWEDGILIGLLASLETLLCIEAIDKLDRRNRITPLNRELIAQGIGNMTCGLLGAIPMTAVVVRGRANVDAGAKTKLSAFTHGVFLLAAVLLIPFLLNKIPYASLAAILLMTGYNLTKPKLYRNVLSSGGRQFIPFLITIIAILFTDLLIGVSIGLLISIYFIVRNNFKAEYKIIKTIHSGIETDYIKLNSNVTFLNKVKLRKVLDDIPEKSIITIDGRECNFIDYDILEIISEYEIKAKERNIQLKILGIEIINTMAIH